MIYPIGSIYISTNSANPSTYLGGTWEAFATGRTLVGIDANDTSFDTVEEVGGEKTHTLTTTEMPSHNHTQPYRIFVGGAKETNGLTTGSAFSDTGVGRVSSAINSAGGSQAHNNLQPYIVVYMWKRTA